MMTYKKVGPHYLVRLEKDDHLVSSLLSLTRELNLTSAWISGLGAVSWVELGHYDLVAQAYTWHKKEELLEIAGVQGNLTMVDDQPFIHMHGSFSDSSFRTYAGHVQEAAIAGTGEFLITPFDETITRTHSDEVGLKLLDV